MKKLALFIALFILAQAVSGQNETSRKAAFSSTTTAAGVKFTPVCPPLTQIAGGKEAFYTYYWEFGDGSFATAPEPLHNYPDNRNYKAGLFLIAHYDDGSNPTGYWASVTPQGAGAKPTVAPSILASVFESERQSIALKAHTEARPGDELVLILSYRNLQKTPTDGELYLFLNEKQYPKNQFALKDTRTHFGESPSDARTSMATDNSTLEWAFLPDWRPGAGAATSPFEWTPAPPKNLEYLLENSRKAYKDEHTWLFPQIGPGETRNLFFTLDCLPEMMKDTSVTLHVKGIFAPTNPTIPAEEFILDIPIVSSHDPNAIMVSDSRVNYRAVLQKKLEYKVQFQNNGKGPAKKVEVRIEIPEGLQAGKMKPLKWYPACPICPKEVGAQSCLDTATTANSLIFTFRNIALPGSHEEGVTEYDSTKGFIKYRIEPDKNMPKRDFHSRARIVFDKNPPIYTNYSRTRFRIGLSPGPKAGYGFSPGADQSSYYFLGISASPYKSWRVYPQVELLTGIRGRTEFDADGFQTDTLRGMEMTDMNDIRFRSDTAVSSFRSGSRGFTSVEIPVLVRKNFNRFVGMGIGGSARLFFYNGDQTLTERKSVLTYVYDNAIMDLKWDGNPVNSESISVLPTNSRETRYTLFADLSFGSVRAGPNLGIRGGYVFGKNEDPKPFVQLSLEVKL